MKTLIGWLQAAFLALAAAHNNNHLSPRASTVPAPIVIPASQEFEGNDGPWSSFTIRLGTPEQVVNVLVSTASYQTWAVIPESCSRSQSPNCPSLRGGEFDYNQSTTWKPNTVNPNGTFALGLETNLGYDEFGQYGYDTVALGFQGSGGPVLNQQILAGIGSEVYFYFGVFGLNPRPTNFTDYNDPVPSYMSNLKAQNLIPSLSWAYTAGNQYHSGTTLGSLTLGGYDRSRFEPNDVDFDFIAVDKKDLSVQISSITYTQAGKNTTLSSTPISAFLDSTLPWLYLPLSVCKAFEKAFGIEYSEEGGGYPVNDTQHEILVSNAATVTFTLRNPAKSGQVDITLPYGAFDLVSEFTNGSARYFPLQRADNSSQYTLGRTFFQEAYVSADYERRKFNVSQCSWGIASTEQKIVAIPSLDDERTRNNSTTTPSKRTSTGAIVGGAVGGLAGLALLITAGYFIVRFIRKRKKTTAELDNDGERKAELDSKTAPQELGGQQQYRHEVDGKRLMGQELVGDHKSKPELGGDYRPGHELDAGPHAAEMPAREAPAAELP